MINPLEIRQKFYLEIKKKYYLSTKLRVFITMAYLFSLSILNYSKKALYSKHYSENIILYIKFNV